ncbi:MAG: hypothetical protein LBU45_00045 [Azoarcus sp.]|jgi:hypothetical protein|nr:hypothetical protein [Azoarcus sp.]
MLKRTALIAAGLMAGAFLLSTHTSSYVPEPSLESAMFDKTETYCFGRFLVDIPKEAELKYQDNDYTGVKINAEFDVRKFRPKINETLEKRKKGEGLFNYIRSEYPDDANKQLIVSSADLWGDISYAIDAFTLNPEHKPGSGYFFFFSGDSYDIEKLEKVISIYHTILSSVRYRSEHEIPKEPGFCFKDGCVENDGETSQNEDAELQFRLKDYPDVWISVSSAVLWVEEKQLLERTRGVKKFLEGKIKIFSEKAREVNSMEGEESLVSFPAKDGTGDAHYFKWETLGELGNPLKPDVYLEIETGTTPDGEGTASSLTAQQVLELYEAVLKSIRLRPTESKPADAKPVGEQSRLPLGTRVASWQPCPQAGLWECEPPQVEGARRRHFQSGQRLPPVTVPDARSLWQRLRGQPAKCAIDTVWTLVEDVPDT